ncbi:MULTISPECIES: NAD(P)-dependent alcohol dehydrogenase [Gordonia]|uniref:NAD(P)-dependent alcohol dehydrogenase n=1 Tax=Gordonia tangerina TaxID=2911060 RepID=A0ABS9DLL7_9ACTN|nr:NAD(P)-dependent alcohol dehydrogenase [Gordonia tangerina]MCF3939457.1 NAD(P)-dependent alcohol dehydrogenase [Gordonia tangerina]
MRASVLHPDGALTIDERPVPQPAAGEVLVRVGAVGLCGSDAHYLRHGRIGEYVVTAPIVLGHEAGGVIVGVGAYVSASRVGQRVSIEPQTPDMASPESRSGRYNLCPHMRFFATPPVDGALCEYVTIGDAFAHAVPDHVSDEAAALCEPLSVAIAAIRKAEVAVGDSVLIAGAGPIGLLCAQVARAVGADRIVMSEPDAQRRAMASTFGATDVVDPGGPSARVDGVTAFIDASGVAAAAVEGIRALSPAGRAVLVGMGADEMTLPTSVIQNREIVLTGVFRYANTWPTALSLISSGRVDVDAMVTGRFGLDEVRAALDADRTPGSIKAIVYPGGLPDPSRPGPSQQAGLAASTGASSDPHADKEVHP